MAAIKASDFTPKWNRTASLPEDDVKATAIAISDDNIYFTTNKDAYRIDLATGNMLADGDDSDDDFDMSTGDIASISAWKSDYAAIVTIDGTALTVMSIDLNAEPASDIPAIAPSAADAPAYNLAGQPVGPDYKGIVIKNGKKVLLK